MTVTEPIRSKHQVRELAGYYLNKGQIRNYVLILMGVHTALRISDLLRLRWDDVYDFENKRIRETITITEKKTGKSKIIALNKSIITTLNIYSKAAEQGAFLIINKNTGKPRKRLTSCTMYPATLCVKPLATTLGNQAFHLPLLWIFITTAPLRLPAVIWASHKTIKTKSI